MESLIYFRILAEVHVYAKLKVETFIEANYNDSKMIP